jgi:hypothetical protein
MRQADIADLLTWKVHFDKVVVCLVNISRPPAVCLPAIHALSCKATYLKHLPLGLLQTKHVRLCVTQMHSHEPYVRAAMGTS